MPSSIGELLLMSDGEALTAVHMEIQRYPVRRSPDWQADDRKLKSTREQLQDSRRNAPDRLTQFGRMRRMIKLLKTAS